MKVRATKTGHYGGFMREPGDVFEISEKTFPKMDGEGRPQVKDGKIVMASAFSEIWMERVPEQTAETPVAKPRKVSPLEVLKEKKEKPPETLSEVTELI